MKPRLLIAQNLLFSSALLALVSSTSASDLDVTNFGGQIPSTEEFINALEPRPTVRTRSLAPSQPSKKRSVSLGIEFTYNSYELTESAQDVLNRLGGALASPQLSEHMFMIEGHTDTVGSTKYNQELSEKRAMSVKNYLVNVFGIEPSRLEEVGRGETALLDEADSTNSVNRRVQIINLAQ